MDDTKKASDMEDQPIGETGGDVRAIKGDTSSEEVGEKGGEATQKKQEEESFKEYEEKRKSEDKDNQPDYDDLWGED